MSARRGSAAAAVASSRARARTAATRSASHGTSNARQRTGHFVAWIPRALALSVQFIVAPHTIRVVGPSPKIFPTKNFRRDSSVIMTHCHAGLRTAAPAAAAVAALRLNHPRLDMDGRSLLRLLHHHLLLRLLHHHLLLLHHHHLLLLHLLG